MADLTIDEAISRIEGMAKKVADVAVQIMQSECPKRTGALAAGIHATPEGKNAFFVGPENQEVANYVVHGRKEVTPEYRWVIGKDGKRHRHALHWKQGVNVFAMRSKAVPPNDFVEETKSRLESMTFTL